jgi:hypothetical protein
MLINTINNNPEHEWGHFVNLDDDTPTESTIANIEEKSFTLLDYVYLVCNILWLLLNRH